MKKIAAALTAAMLTLGSVSMFTASAESSSDYSPSLYFKAYDSENYQILPNGTVYVRIDNTNNAVTSINAGVYIKDDVKKAGHIIAKWKSESEYIKLNNLKDPVTVYGQSPYTEFKSAKSIRLDTDTDKNTQSVSYALGLSVDPFTLSGNTSDAYPLAVFDAFINTDTPAGMYTVDFMTEETSNLCDILYKYGADIISKEFFPSGDHALSLRINVSDRMLGDVNNDGVVDGVDATLTLRAYTLIMSNMDSGFTPAETAAADVDGDGAISGIDATLMLRYYTYVLSNGDKDFLTFLKTEK
ncbi:MAG: dockerin type I domain-containing protein [Ruminococcus flavefaciens]|nr:dockerin type I domain-containing protein [Ruminococcus flavefaciens]MCM1059973.1 dockerin type I domain-containing protein [Eubacterium sp.]